MYYNSQRKIESSESTTSTAKVSFWAESPHFHLLSLSSSNVREWMDHHTTHRRETGYVRKREGIDKKIIWIWSRREVRIAFLSLSKLWCALPFLTPSLSHSKSKFHSWPEFIIGPLLTLMLSRRVLFLWC